MLGNNDTDNEITLTAFRLLIMDLLELFTTMNEGTINVLGELIRQSDIVPCALISARTLFRVVEARR
jgi:ANTH domain